MVLMEWINGLNGIQWLLIRRIFMNQGLMMVAYKEFLSVLT